VTKFSCAHFFAPGNTRKKWFTPSLLLLTVCVCRIGQSAELPLTYPDILIDDAKHVLSAPAEWQATQWTNFALGSLAVAATAAYIDNPWREKMLGLPRDNKFANIDRLGAEYSVGVIGAFYLAGSLAQNEVALKVAQDSLTASIIASGLITPGIKLLAGRSRPNENLGNQHFQSLAASQPSSSFPSGHTTEAFALASVISAHYESSFITGSAYTLATLVGLARTYRDVHFASDVLAGALIGRWVGLTVVEHRQNPRSVKMIVLPELGPSQLGLRLSGNF
jgi:hypothetical protein